MNIELIYNGNAYSLVGMGRVQKFQIHKAYSNDGEARLPSAHTCKFE